jgi:pyrroloquinoline quinone biosynthesis protein B
LELPQAVELLEADGRPSGIELSPFALAGKPPLHLMQSFAPDAQDNVGLRAASGGPGLVYASALADLPELMLFEGAGALFVDGTFWSEEELPALGVATGPARSMAHLPMAGEHGSLRQLANIRATHRYFTHVNNTNPVLDESSPEHQSVVDSGWRIAFDGLRLTV